MITELTNDDVIKILSTMSYEELTQKLEANHSYWEITVVECGFQMVRQEK